MKRNLLPLNLQYFAEGETETPETATPPTEEKPDVKKETPEPEKKEPEKKEPEKKSYEEVLIENAKLKRALDKTSSEAAEYKHKWKDSLTEKEQIDLEQAEAKAKHEEEFEALVRKDKIHDLTETFMDLGYSKESAKKAAAAQVDGDTETLFMIQKQQQEQMLKAEEAKWIASRPQVQVGSGAATDEEDPFVKGFKSVKQFH